MKSFICIYVQLDCCARLDVALILTFPVPITDKQRKLTKKFIFILLCGASKSFIKAFKALVKPFEVPQRSLKIKIFVNFYFDTTFANARGGKG